MNNKSASGIRILKEAEIPTDLRRFLRLSQLHSFGRQSVWSVEGSNAAINYSTHGLFRYFGKFPAPIAKHLIETHTDRDDLVLDPACGSGTTGVEALLLGRKAKISDINPLSTLVARVKTRHIAEERLSLAIHDVVNNSKKMRKVNLDLDTIDEINLDHWFLPRSVDGLTRLSKAIRNIEDESIQEFLKVSFASVVRRVSRATTQQGRMFLDAASAIEEVLPVFEKTAIKNAQRVSTLPKSKKVTVETRDILKYESYPRTKASLVIFHPPYFNAYKYSSINSLEMAWLGMSRKEMRKEEIREFFKVGKPENSDVYVQDMIKSLRAVRSRIQTNSTLCLMIGDTRIRGEYIPVTQNILNQVVDIFTPVEVALRVPRYTEASWAASQRRNSTELGITMYDFVITLKAC